MRKVKQLVSEFELGLDVEVALLLMDVAVQSELLDEEMSLRRAFRVLAGSTERAQTILWIVEISDEAVSGLLGVGVEFLATR